MFPTETRSLSVSIYGANVARTFPNTFILFKEKINFPLAVRNLGTLSPTKIQLRLQRSL